MSDNKEYKDWHVVTTCEIYAPASEVWEMVGGFYNINQWHPDIDISEVPEDQYKNPYIRRKLTFPGQDPTFEELVFVDNENMFYKYKWHSGEWGEIIQKYHSQIRVIEKEAGKSCIMQWSCNFYYFEDGLTQFYHNGYDGLIKMYGGKILT
jgi:hypothetical protein